MFAGGQEPIQHEPPEDVQQRVLAAGQAYRGCLREEGARLEIRCVGQERKPHSGQERVQGVEATGQGCRQTQTLL